LRARLWAAGFFLLATGCARKDGLFPLEQGNTWSYTVISGFSKYPIRLKVTKPVSVAGVNGYQLESNAGVSRLAWRSGMLMAETLNSTRFDPALPLLQDTKDKASRTWKGKVTSLAQPVDGKAEISQEPQKVEVAGRTYQAIKVHVELTVPGRIVTVDSYFADGIGLIQQEQRTGDGTGAPMLTTGLSYLEGP
jgi:hypothetical protein